MGTIYSFYVTPKGEWKCDGSKNKQTNTHLTQDESVLLILIQNGVPEAGIMIRITAISHVKQSGPLQMILPLPA
jgi:hypothetical protein